MVGNTTSSVKLTREKLSEYFHLPMKDAAEDLGVCSTVMKKACRKYNINRWPNRKIKAIERVAKKVDSRLRRTDLSSEEVTDLTNIKQTLETNLKTIKANPNCNLNTILSKADRNKLSLIKYSGKSKRTPQRKLARKLTSDTKCEPSPFGLISNTSNPCEEKKSYPLAPPFFFPTNLNNNQGRESLTNSVDTAAGILLELSAVVCKQKEYSNSRVGNSRNTLFTPSTQPEKTDPEDLPQLTFD